MASAGVLAAVVCGAPTFGATLKLDARTIFEQAVSQNIHLTPDGSALQLDSGELYEDDGPAAGYSYKPNEDKVSSTVWIRKRLVIADPRASAAVLMVGPGGDLKIRVNGRAQTVEPPRPAGFGLWQAYTINPAALKPGVNNIEMSGSGQVWIARSDDSPVPLPHRSARSTDGGATWKDDRLGLKGDISGEYYVRIFLEHYRTKGTIVLPVMDAGNLSGATFTGATGAPGSVRIALDADGDGSQGVEMRVRSGSTYVPKAGTWSEWAPLSRDGVLKRPRGRFMQAEVTLSTNDPLATPRLREIEIEAAPTPASDWTRAVKVVDAHNEEIIRSSIPFRYEPFTHPRLKEYRAAYHLDDVVRGAKTEFELMGKLAVWASQQWPWEQWHLDEFYPAWDAMEILKKHTDGKTVGGFCEQYDLVFLQACESFGLAGRQISISNGALGRPNTSGHEPSEIWSNEYRKWVYVDGTGAWYAVDEATGVPLSLWEVRQRQVSLLRGGTAPATKIVVLAKTAHQWRNLTEDVSFAELRLIPRSNFLEQKNPLPLNQGRRGWFWTGHYVWNDTDAGADLVHAHRVARRNDFEWTLNQAHYVLEAGAKFGELRVELDTETPGFETFVAEIDGAAKRAVTSGFVWQLHKGKNRLKVWPKNNAGRDGIASWIELELPAS